MRSVVEARAGDEVSALLVGIVTLNSILPEGSAEEYPSSRRRTHGRRQPRRSLLGMLLHIDASKHAWLQDGHHYDHDSGRCDQ